VVGLLLVVASYVGLFALMLSATGQQNNASVALAIGFVVSLLGVLHLFGSKKA